MRLPHGASKPGIEIGAGLLAIASASLAAIPFVKEFDNYDTSNRIAIILSIAAAVIGGALALVKFAFGPPIAAGGVTLFASAAVPLAVSRIDIPTAFSTADSKFVLAAAVTGVIAFVLCSMLFLGRATSSLGGLIAVLALVTVACTAALIHVEDNHGLAAAGILGSGLIVAIFILIGAVKGRWGVIAALVAAAAQVPGWLDLAVDTDDRKAAAIAGLVCMLGIVVLAAVATLLASSATADGYRRGPEHAVVSAAVQPMVQPHAIPAGGLETRLGPILMPVDPVVQSRGTPPPPVSAGPVSRKAAGGTATVVSVAGSPGTPAAQWAADPYGRFQVRYFDGTAWTHHVASDGVTGSDPAV